MRVNAATVGEIVFPLPPLPEQRRIVERIDALFAEIAEGEAALDADLLERIRAEQLNHTPMKTRTRRVSAVKGSAQAELAELPIGWVWTTLGEIADIVGGVTVDQKRGSSLFRVGKSGAAVVHRSVSEQRRANASRLAAKSVSVRRAVPRESSLLAAPLKCRRKAPAVPLVLSH
jgi:type I restriction enzyme, S subunit